MGGAHHNQSVSHAIKRLKTEELTFSPTCPRYCTLLIEMARVTRLYGWLGVSHLQTETTHLRTNTRLVSQEHVIEARLRTPELAVGHAVLAERHIERGHGVVREIGLNTELMSREGNSRKQDSMQYQLGTDAGEAARNATRAVQTAQHPQPAEQHRSSRKS